MNDFGSINQRTNVAAMPIPKRRVPRMPPRMGMRQMDPSRVPVMPAVSSMDMPNHAGQTGPVPMKGIVNSLVKRR